MSLKNVLAVALGIMSAIGGFVDIGDLVFNTQAGATFGFQLLWVVVVGVVGIIVYSEMCGRVSAVSKRPVFDLVRERTGFGAGARDADRLRDRQPDDVRGRGRRRRDLLPAALGPALPLLIPLAVLGSSQPAWVLPFGWIERVFGYLGLGLLVFAVAAIKLHPDWGRVAHGFVPGHHVGGSLLGLPLLRRRPARRGDDAVRGLLLLVGRGRGPLGPRGLGLNKVTAMIGYALGGFLSFALMIVAAVLFLPRGISPAVPGHAGAGRRARARAGRPAARARRHPLRGRRRGDRDVASPAPTTWRSSSAGAGARRSGRPRRRASRSRGS